MADRLGMIIIIGGLALFLLGRYNIDLGQTVAGIFLVIGGSVVMILISHNEEKPQVRTDT